MRRIFAGVVILGLAFLQPVSAGLPMAGCEMGMAMACCAVPVDPCGDCHMGPLSTPQPLAESAPVSVADQSQADTRSSSGTLLPPKEDDRSNRDQTFDLSEEYPEKLYDLYSDHRI